MTSLRNSIIVLFCLAIVANCSAIIKNASYGIRADMYRKIDDAEFGKQLRRQHNHTIKYYTFDGTFITEEKDSRIDTQIERDPSAPKPQPITYKIFYWRGISAGNLLGSPFYKSPADRPGYFIVFFDRHRNVLGEYRYDKSEQTITFWDESYNELTLKVNNFKMGHPDFPLDLSKAKQKK